MSKDIATLRMIMVASLSLVLLGCGGARDDDRAAGVETRPQPAPIAHEIRPSDVLFDAVLHVAAGRRGVWLGGFEPPYLWFVQPDGSTGVPVEAGGFVLHLAAAGGYVWVIHEDGAVDAFGLQVVDEASRTVRTVEGFPAACQSRPTAFEEQLWVWCGDRLLVFDAERAGPVRAPAALSRGDLVAAESGLWSFSRSEVVCVAGRAKGSRWPLDTIVAPDWRVDGTIAWGFAFADRGSTFLRLDLVSGRLDRYPISLDDFIFDFVVVDAEAWVAPHNGGSLVRFRPVDGREPVARVEMTSPEPARRAQLAYAHGAIWIVTLAEDTPRILRIVASDRSE